MKTGTGLRTAITRFHTRFRFIASLPENAVVLDIGCGNGFVQKQLNSYRRDIKFISVDAVNFSDSYPPGAFFTVNVVKDALPLEVESVDAVFCCHMLEHLSSCDLVLSEMARVLKRDGAIYLETPGTRSLWLPSLNFLSNQKATVNFFDDPTHIRPFTRNDLREIAEQIGIRQVKTGFARNYIYCLLSPLLIPYMLLKRDKQKLTTVLWSLTGSCVYIWGKHIEKTDH